MMADPSQRALLALFGLAGDAAAILLVAWMLTLIGRKNAGFRHAVWGVAFGALLLLPMVLLVVPAPHRGPVVQHVNASGSLERKSWTAAKTEIRANSCKEVPAPASRHYAGFAAKGSPGASQAGAVSRVTRLDWNGAARSLLAVWACGVMASLVWVGFAVQGLWALRRSSAKLPWGDGEFDGLWSRFAGSSRHRTVQLRVSSREFPRSAMTWGCWRPVILLPRCSSDWPVERREAVLLHELAHVRRCDSFWQLLSTLGSALLWFHPGVWMASAAMRAEAETAADDAVISCGIRPTEYASNLIALAAEASELGRRRYGFEVSMIQPSGLEKRVRSIIEGDRRRRGATLTQVASVATAVFLFAFLMLNLRPLLATGPDQRQALFDEVEYVMAKRARGLVAKRDGGAVRNLQVQASPAQGRARTSSNENETSSERNESSEDLKSSERDFEEDSHDQRDSQAESSEAEAKAKQLAEKEKMEADALKLQSDRQRVEGDALRLRTDKQRVEPPAAPTPPPGQDVIAPTDNRASTEGPSMTSDGKISSGGHSIEKIQAVRKVAHPLALPMVARQPFVLPVASPSFGKFARQQAFAYNYQKTQLFKTARMFEISNTDFQGPKQRRQLHFLPSGDSRDISVKPFHAVEVNGSIRVTVRAGRSPSLHADGCPDALAGLGASVEDGVLRLNGPDGVCVTVETPTLETLHVAGGSVCECSGFDEKSFSLVESGESHVRLSGHAIEFRVEETGHSVLAADDIRGASLHTVLTGASVGDFAGSFREVEVQLDGGSAACLSRVESKQLTFSLNAGSAARASGSTNEVTLSSSGGAVCDLSGLAARFATISVNGGTKTRLNVSRSLTASASGSAEVSYGGHPLEAKINSTEGSRVAEQGP